MKKEISRFDGKGKRGYQEVMSGVFSEKAIEKACLNGLTVEFDTEENNVNITCTTKVYDVMTISEANLKLENW